MTLTIQPDAVSFAGTVQPAPVSYGGSVVPPPVEVTDAQMIAALTADGYTVTAAAPTPPPVVAPTSLVPTGLVLTAQAYTLELAFTAPAAPIGKTIACYKATGVGNAALFIGASMHSPLLLQGVNGAWAGGSLAVTVHAVYTDGTISAESAASKSVVLQRTDGSALLQTSPVFYAGGTFNGKGDFNFGNGVAPGGLAADYFDTTGLPGASPSGAGAYCIKFTSSSGGGLQMYWPVNAAGTAGFDLSKFTEMSFDYKSDVAGRQLDIYFEADNDVADGGQQFVTAAAANTWQTAKLSLAGFKFSNLEALKVAMATNAGTFWVNNIVFS